MNLNGTYKVFANGEQIACSHNAIMPGGFEFIQKIFTNVSNKDIEKIDLTKNHVITAGQWSTMGSISNAIDVFKNYDSNSYTYPTQGALTENLYYDVVFKNDNNEKQYKQISAIGIDFICMNTPINISSNTNIDSKYLNANLKLKYNNSLIQNNFVTLDDFIAFPIFRDVDFIKSNQGYSQKVYYFNKPLNVSQLRLQFNQFNNFSTILPYRVYAINLYENKSILRSPSYITLYKKNEAGEQQVLITKPISISYIDNSYDENGENISNYSVVFKTTLEFDDLSSTDQVSSVSLDYISDNAIDNYIDINGQKHIQFSHANYQIPWNQQEFTAVQLQYQLFFTNNN